eukprot:gb/GECH01011199.1/.p1 GENE.gb/GECH01011199.1/~~gb/GECH01011199.1/.p1  ORF type:complete len:169 (+),score=27.44 gb/GECH01011199.1/:1-507(+)
MPPKFDPSEKIELFIKLRCGGDIAASVLAPRLGPMGVSPKKVIEQIKNNTKEFHGHKITLKITIQNRQPTVEIHPTSKMLIFRALKVRPREGYKKKGPKDIKHNGNLTIDQVTDIAKQLRHKSNSRTLAGCVKEILGTCLSIGCTVEGKDPRDVQQEITESVITIPEE